MLIDIPGGWVLVILVQTMKDHTSTAVILPVALCLKYGTKCSFCRRPFFQKLEDARNHQKSVSWLNMYIYIYILIIPPAPQIEKFEIERF